jgi:hypothetical protein
MKMSFSKGQGMFLNLCANFKSEMYTFVELALRFFDFIAQDVKLRTVSVAIGQTNLMPLLIQNFFKQLIEAEWRCHEAAAMDEAMRSPSTPRGQVVTPDLCAFLTEYFL